MPRVSMMKLDQECLGVPMDIKTNVVGMSLLTVIGAFDVEAHYTYVIEKEFYNNDPASEWAWVRVTSVTHITHQGQTMQFYDGIVEDLINEVQHWVDIEE